MTNILLDHNTACRPVQKVRYNTKYLLDSQKTAIANVFLFEIYPNNPLHKKIGISTIRRQYLYIRSYQFMSSPS